MIKKVLYFCTFVLLFQGCSSKQYFEPEDSLSLNVDTQSLSANIIAFNRDGATLDNNLVITKEGVLKEKLPEGFTFINYSNKRLIASNNKDQLYIDSKILDLNKHVIAASVQGDILALLLNTNTIEIYNLKSKKVVFKEYLSKSLVNDVRIANPVFLGELLLFPSLDGKIVIVDYKKNVISNSIVLDANGQFNNLIYLDVVDDNLIAATSSKIISVSSANVIIKDFEIRDVISNEKEIYIATNDGQVMHLSSSLETKNSRKYKFAKFYTLAFGKELYALESQGYLVAIKPDFSQDAIYDFSFDEEDKVISIGNTIYFDNSFVILK